MGTESATPQLKRLWQETFGDSPEYVDLLYSLYYNPRLCLHEERNGKIVASLTGVPYSFSSGSGEDMRGVYLCGLATRPEYRRQGIMQNLIAEEENRAFHSGYRFTFLIPADDHLRLYYQKMGYRSVMNIKELKISRECENRIFTAKETSAPKFSILAKGIPEVTNRVYELLLSTGNQFRGVSIRHSRQDVEGILQEVRISGGEWWYDSSLSAAVAMTGTGVITLLAYCDSGRAIQALRTLIYSHGEVTLRLPEEHPIWHSLSAETAICKPYAMTKPLNPDQKLPMPISAWLLLD